MTMFTSPPADGVMFTPLDLMEVARLIDEQSNPQRSEAIGRRMFKAIRPTEIGSTEYLLAVANLLANGLRRTTDPVEKTRTLRMFLAMVVLVEHQQSGMGPGVIRQ